MNNKAVKMRQYKPTAATLSKMRKIEEASGMTFKNWLLERVSEGYSQEWLIQETELSWYGLRRMLKDLGISTNGFGCAWRSTGKVCVLSRLRELGITDSAMKHRIYRKLKKGLHFDKALKLSQESRRSHGGNRHNAKNGETSKQTQCQNLA